MRTHQGYQATALLLYLGAFCPATGNPLPENSYGSDLDNVNMFNGDDPGSSDINWDDTSIWSSDQGDQMLSFDSTSTADFSPVDESLIAYGNKLKAPYCGTTEQAVCCSDMTGFTGCRHFDPSDFLNCKGPNQACCGRIVSGQGQRCYKGTPEWVEVAPTPGEIPEKIPEEVPNLVPSSPALPYVDPFDWWEYLRFPPSIPWPNLNPLGGGAG